MIVRGMDVYDNGVLVNRYVGNVVLVDETFSETVSFLDIIDAISERVPFHEPVNRTIDLHRRHDLDYDGLQHIQHELALAGWLHLAVVVGLMIRILEDRLF